MARIKSRAQIGITIAFSILANLLFMIIVMALDSDVSKAFYPLVAFPLNLLIIRLVFPTRLGIPFGKVDADKFARGIGLFLPKRPGRHVLLGVLLAACSLSGMLIGSLLTGRYEFELGNVTTDQVAFATVPGVWEEVFFRGVLMMVLLFNIKDLRKAMVAQCVIFGLLHFQGVEPWQLVDLLSVAIIGFVAVYTAHKTNSLMPAIIFHFLHDALIFLVQVPDGDYEGVYENLVFYVSLWAMLGIGLLIIQFVTKRWDVRESVELYDLGKRPTGTKF
jgi:membrane protease YdiL (CAAX protease family)